MFTILIYSRFLLNLQQWPQNAADMQSQLAALGIALTVSGYDNESTAIISVQASRALTSAEITTLESAWGPGVTVANAN